MIGRYHNFPSIVHGFARFTHHLSTRELQRAILQTFLKLNQETCGISALTLLSSSEYMVSFEFGIAEGITFSFLDDEEMERIENSIVRKALPILDFFCVSRYHVVNRGKRLPLKFDYQLLRLVFYKYTVELQIHHQRGSQRIPLEGLTKFVAKRVNEQLMSSNFEPLNLKLLRTL